MNWLGARPLIAAYVCPRGAFAVRCRRAATGYRVEQSLEVLAPIAGPREAADRLVTLLRDAGVARADLVVAMRGFGTVYHVLQLPPAQDEDVLDAVLQREIRRLEPQLADPVIGWTPLPVAAPVAGQAAERNLLAAAMPRATLDAFAGVLGAAGHRLRHLTALPAAVQRLVEEFDPASESSGVVVPLPDGAFIGFALDGGIRLLVEPPLPQEAQHEMASLVEELQLGLMFVRQQFRGAQLGRVAVFGQKPSIDEQLSLIAERLGVTVSPLGGSLSPQALAAIGALIDSRAPKPLALAGDAATRRAVPAYDVVEFAARAALVVVGVLAAWVLIEAARARGAASALAAAEAQIERDSVTVQPIREVALSRRGIDDAARALRVAASDRAALQQALAGVAAAARAPIALDTLRFERQLGSWLVVTAGTAGGTTNARAVQTLHDMYYDLPRRIAVDSVNLLQLTYADTGDVEDGGRVRFRLSFRVMPGREE